MNTEQQRKDEISPFLYKSQPCDARLFARPVVGVTLTDGAHLSVRKVGWRWCEQEVVTNVQLVCGGVIVASGVDAVSRNILAARYPFRDGDAAYLLRAIEEI